MRTPSLSRRSRRLPNGRLVSAYEYDGEEVWAYDSAQDAIAVIDLFGREDIDPGRKASLVFGAIFPCLQCAARSEEYLRGLLAHVAWEAYGLDVTEGNEYASECDAPVFDFDEDAARIKAALLSYYGIDWDSGAGSIAYSDFCALLAQLAEADHETVPGFLPNFKTSLAQAIYYRTAQPPKANRHNKELCKAFAGMRDGLALGASRRDGAEAANAEAQAMLAEARRGA